MKVSRRNFFGLAAAAPVAAKSTIEDAAQKMAFQDPGFSRPPDLSDPADSGLDRPYILNLLKDLDQEKFDMDSLRRVYRLDPDLVALRSFSLSRRIQIQARRDHEARIRGERNWAMQQLAKL